MSEGGEKTCPLCAEEMDLTDQHLKPCKCGYEICVWCWHHIMGMAEKEETEGRCPACRIPYNKEKIVGTTANHERLVSEMNVEKKLKSQKGKSKTSEARKQLGNVRVIQRNLVYVMGLPLDLANEELLQKRDYFSLYGKVMKVSMSRTSAGAIQQFANSTCSVYITYSKEEEAVRCIQSVNGFVLDGRPLKACFGTTKYCHAWLRNVACTNPDCLYLHEIGSQDDSFTKDEVVSSYTRNRVQQITGSVISTQRSSGNMLPPPADDYCNNTSASKPITKTATTTNCQQNSASSFEDSPPNDSRSVALPPGASWGTRSVNNTQPSSISCSNGPQKPAACNNPVTYSTEVATPNQVSSPKKDTGYKSVPDQPKAVSQDKSKPETLLPVKKDSSLESTGPAVDSDSIDITDGNIENICSDLSSMDIQGHVEKITERVSEIDDDLLSFNKQRLNDPEVVINRKPDFFDSLLTNNPSYNSAQFNSADSSIGVGFDRQVVDRNGNFGSNFPINHLYYSSGSVNTGENNIVSNIFSMDFDESVTSPQNIDKLSGGNDKRQGSFGPPGPTKSHNSSNQSRFLFARAEEPMMSRQVSDFGQSIDYFEQDFKQPHPFGHDFSNRNSLHHDKFMTQNGFPNLNGTALDTFAGSHQQNKLSEVSRSQVSAPPGFSAPNRNPPPGFTSYERTEQNTFSGNNIIEAASLLRNQSHDIELADPAILKVIKGTLQGGPHNPGLDNIVPNFSHQLSSYEDSRLKSFLQKRSLPPNPNQMFSDLADNFTPIGGDAYGIPSRVVMERTLANNLSQFSQYTTPSNGQWNNGWNEYSNGNNLGMAELLRNERLGYNKFYNGYEDSKMRMMPGSGNLYNGTYGI